MAVLRQALKLLFDEAGACEVLQDEPAIGRMTSSYWGTFELCPLESTAFFNSRQPVAWSELIKHNQTLPSTGVTASVRLEALSLVNIDDTWNLTVCSEAQAPRNSFIS